MLTLNLECKYDVFSCAQPSLIPLFLTLNNLAPSGACSIGTCVIGFNSQVFFPGSSHTCSVIQLSTLLGGLILLIQLYNIYNFRW